MEDLPEDLPFWPEIAATSENCIGTDCPRYNDCFVTRMRQRAAESDVVIVNHHLLCADAAVRQSAFGEVIPACRYAIVDEAHQLEDVATQYFGIAVSNYRIDDLGRDAERAVVGEARPRSGSRGRPPRDVDRVRDHASDLLRGSCRCCASRRGLGAESRARVNATTLAARTASDGGRRWSRALEAHGSRRSR